MPAAAKKTDAALAASVNRTTAQMDAQKVAPDELKKPWCVDVDLDDGEDFTLRFDSEDAAEAAVEGVLADGMVARDLSAKVNNKYNTMIYPLHKVRSFRIWQDKDAEAAIAAAKK